MSMINVRVKQFELSSEFLLVKHLLAQSNVALKREFNYLKPKQYTSIVAAIKGDLLAVLPTGYGKTVIFQVLPYTKPQGCVVIISPLNSILCEQKAHLGPSCVLVEEENDVAQITLDTRYILGHPEILTSNWMKSALKNISQRITHIVVDEVHCVLSWGQSKFRPAFLKIPSLRSILLGAKILALTATATQLSQKAILKELYIDQEKVITHSPDRANVFLQIKRRPPSTGGNYSPADSINAVVDAYLKELKDAGKNSPKTIIYAKLEWCGYIHHRALSLFLNKHPDETTVQKPESKELDSLIQHYHAPQTTKMKKLITTSMQNVDGKLRLLLATQAYGMGTDAPNVRRVVHLGPPSQMESYMQELGRCGRDNESACATLYFNSSDIASNVPHLQDAMRAYCTLTSCRRMFIVQHYGFCELEDPPIGHKCCDNCAAKCTCKCCLAQISEEVMNTLLTDVCLKELLHGGINRIDKKTTMHLQQLLAYYFTQENAIITCTMLPETVTGLSEKLAKDISVKAHCYKDVSCLEKDYPELSKDFLANIVHIVNATLSI